MPLQNEKEEQSYKAAIIGVPAVSFLRLFFPIKKTYIAITAKMDPINEDNVWSMLNMVICQPSLF